MRLFVAIDLDDRSRAAIAGEQVRIRKSLIDGTAPRWIDPAQMHVTLAFLGEVDPALAARLQSDLSAPAGQPAFDLVLAGIGVFPPHGAPRALWIGTREGASELRALQQEVAVRIAARGVALEARPFTPHLTIGRWKSSRPSDRRRILAYDGERVVARLRVDHATLYHSRVSAQGSIYTALARANLTTGTRG